MIKKYLQQSWMMLRQSPLFSSLYIAGTGMAIALVMVLAMLYYVKIGDIYPEVNRSRMMVALSAHMQYAEDPSYNMTWNYSIPFVKECFYPLEDVEAVSALSEGTAGMVKPEISKRPVSVILKYTDPAFWRVFEFRFLEGAAFTEADFQSGLPTVVISDELARRVFGATEVVGRELTLNSRRYRICGVVASPSYAMKHSYAHVWLPYTSNPEMTKESGWMSMLGHFQVAILLHSPQEAARVRVQVEEYVRKFNQLPHEGYRLVMHGQPYMHWRSLFYKGHMDDLDYMRVLRQIGVWLLLLLLVPALNLSGMIASRMERRLPELGVRKAFGATGGRLFSQIVWENLLLTVLGGVLGLLVSFAMVFFAQNWLLTMLDGGTKLLPDGAQGVTWDMLFNPVLFLLTFLVCVVLNLISALIPAYLALKENIVYSLSKQK